MPQRYLAILDVGHGNSAVLVDKEGVTVIDSGPGSTLLEYLQSAKCLELETVVISHADRDHISGLIALLASDSVRIKKVMLNTDSSKDSQLWDDLVFTLDDVAKKGKLEFDVALTPTATGKLDRGNIHVEVVAPSRYLASKGAGNKDRKDRALSSNSMSAVIRLTKEKEGVVLLPGDIDAVGLENIAEGGTRIEATVAVFPHHGGKPGAGDPAGFAKRFCELVRPKVIVFSTGRGVHSTPQPEIVRSVKEAVGDVWILCTQMSEHCCDDLLTDQPKHLSGLFARGGQSNCCCAGSILVDLDGDTPELLPNREDHARFVAKAAPNAICLLSRK